jgi:hypothetical protein
MFAMVFLFLMFAGGLWFFSVNEFKAPPAGVVPIPDGFEAIGGDTTGGSGGTTTRWVYLRQPGDMATIDAADLVAEVMTLDGWEHAKHQPLEGVPSRDSLRLLRRGDEWAGISPSTGVGARTREFLDIASIEGDHGTFLVIELGYSNFGVGRRCLICN